MLDRSVCVTSESAQSGSVRTIQKERGPCVASRLRVATRDAASSISVQLLEDIILLISTEAYQRLLLQPPVRKPESELMEKKLVLSLASPQRGY
jgi:hypothetical protein